MSLKKKNNKIFSLKGAVSAVAIMVILTIMGSATYYFSRGVGDSSEEAGEKIESYLGEPGEIGDIPIEPEIPPEDVDIIVPVSEENVDPVAAGFIFNAATQSITGYDGANTNIAIPKSFLVGGKTVTVTSVGARAFKDKGLTGLTIPANLTSVGDEAFSGNNFVNGVILDATISWAGSLATGAFTNSTIGDNLLISENVTKIPNNIFTDSSLTKVEIPSTVTTVGNNAFSENQLSSVSLPTTVITWGENVFSNNQIKEVSFPSTMVSVPNGLFKGNQIDSLVIPSHVVKLGSESFGNNPFRTKLVLSSNLISGGGGSYQNGAFKGSTIGDKLTISPNVYKIQAETFSDAGITSLTIPATVTQVGDRAFSGNKITSLTLSNTAVTWGSSVFKNNLLTVAPIPTVMTAIPTEMYMGNKINVLTIPSYVKTLGNRCFAENPLSGQLILDSNLTAAGTNDVLGAFYGASAGNSLTITTRVTKLPNNIFSYAGLTSLSIPSSVTIVGESAFANNKLTAASLPTTVTSWGKYGYKNNLITDITIPTSMTSIPIGFFGFNKLASLTIPSHVTILWDEAFRDNPFTGNIAINGALTLTGNSLDTSPFLNSPIPSLTFGPNVTKIPNYMFTKSLITSVVIPSNITSVGICAFYRCSLLTSVTVKNLQSNVTVGSNALPAITVYAP